MDGPSGQGPHPAGDAGASSCLHEHRTNLANIGLDCRHSHLDNRGSPVSEETDREHQLPQSSADDDAIDSDIKALMEVVRSDISKPNSDHTGSQWSAGGNENEHFVNGLFDDIGIVHYKKPDTNHLSENDTEVLPSSSDTVPSDICAFPDMHNIVEMITKTNIPVDDETGNLWSRQMKEATGCVGNTYLHNSVSTDTTAESHQDIIVHTNQEEGETAVLATGKQSFLDREKDSVHEMELDLDGENRSIQERKEASDLDTGKESVHEREESGLGRENVFVQEREKCDLDRKKASDRLDREEESNQKTHRWNEEFELFASTKEVFSHVESLGFNGSKQGEIGLCQKTKGHSACSEEGNDIYEGRDKLLNQEAHIPDNIENKYESESTMELQHMQESRVFQKSCEVLHDKSESMMADLDSVTGELCTQAHGESHSDGMPNARLPLIADMFQNEQIQPLDSSVNKENDVNLQQTGNQSQLQHVQGAADSEQNMKERNHSDQSAEENCQDSEAGTAPVCETAETKDQNEKLLKREEEIHGGTSQDGFGQDKETKVFLNRIDVEDMPVSTHSDQSAADSSSRTSLCESPCHRPTTGQRKRMYSESDSSDSDVEILEMTTTDVDLEAILRNQPSVKVDRLNMHQHTVDLSQESNKIRVCPLCKLNFPTAALSKHLMTDHPRCKIPFSCQVCEIGFMTKWQQINHLRLINHTDRTDDGNEVQMILSYAEVKRTQNTLECPCCRKSYKSRAAIDFHMRHTHKCLQMPYVCRFCQLGRLFSRWVENHIFRIHRVHKSRANRYIKINTIEPLSSRSGVVKKPTLLSNRNLKRALHQYICPICKMNLGSLVKVECHFRRIHKENQMPYECEICQKGFFSSKRKEKHSVRFHLDGAEDDVITSSDDLQQQKKPKIDKSDLKHFNVKPREAEENYKCPVCQRKLSSSETLESHIGLQHPAIRLPYDCKFCPITFLSAKNHRNHVYQSHFKNPTADDDCCIKQHPKCFECGLPFLTREGLLRHFRMKHDERKLPFKCWMCDLRFFTQQGVIEHTRLMHEDEVPNKPVSSKTSRTEPSGSENIDVAIDKSVQSSSGSRNNRKCRFATKTTKWISAQKLRSAQINFVCPLCKVKSSSVKALEHHFSLNHGEDMMPFECNFCHKSFFSAKTCKSHSLEIHLQKEKKIAAAQKKRRQKLRRYPHKCAECDEAFMTRSKLVDHFRTRHDERNMRYQCNICRLRFYTSAKLFAHLHRSRRCKVNKQMESMSKKKNTTSSRHSGCDASHYGPAEHVEMLKNKYCPISPSVRLVRLKDTARYPATRKTSNSCQRNPEYPHCDQIVETVEGRADHLHEESDELCVKYNCGLCSRSFANPAYLDAHVKVRHKSQKEIRMKAKFTQNRIPPAQEPGVEEVRRDHSTRGMSETCSLCDKSFKTMAILQLHKRLAHEGPQETSQMVNGKGIINKLKNKYCMKNLHCPKCNLGFYTESSRLKHFRIEHRNATMPFECPTCQKGYLVKSSMLFHCKQFKHGVYEDPVGRAADGYPGYCSSRSSASNASDLRWAQIFQKHNNQSESTISTKSLETTRTEATSTVTHRNWSTAPENHLKCQECDILFPSRTSLMMHCEERHPTDPALSSGVERGDIPTEETTRTGETMDITDDEEDAKLAIDSPASELMPGVWDDVPAAMQSVCIVCTKIFLSKCDLHRRHRAEYGSTHGNSEVLPLICVTCKKEMSSQNHLLQHYMKQHCPKTLVVNYKCWRHDGRLGRSFCPYCDERFVNDAQKRHHIFQKHCDEVDPYCCYFCQTKFTLAPTLVNHFTSEHGYASITETNTLILFSKLNSIPDMYGLWNLSCPLCERIILNSSEAAEEHFSLVHEDVPATHQCNGCDKKFYLNSSFAQHCITCHNYLNMDTVLNVVRFSFMAGNEHGPQIYDILNFDFVLYLSQTDENYNWLCVCFICDNHDNVFYSLYEALKHMQAEHRDTTELWRTNLSILIKRNLLKNLVIVSSMKTPLPPSRKTVVRDSDSPGTISDDSHRSYGDHGDRASSTDGHDGEVCHSEYPGTVGMSAQNSSTVISDDECSDHSSGELEPQLLCNRDNSYHGYSNSSSPGSPDLGIFEDRTYGVSPAGSPHSSSHGAVPEKRSLHPRAQPSASVPWLPSRIMNYQASASRSVTPPSPRPTSISGRSSAASSSYSISRPRPQPRRAVPKARTSISIDLRRSTFVMNAARPRRANPFTQPCLDNPIIIAPEEEEEKVVEEEDKEVEEEDVVILKTEMDDEPIVIDAKSKENLIVIESEDEQDKITNVLDSDDDVTMTTVTRNSPTFSGSSAAYSPAQDECDADLAEGSSGPVHVIEPEEDADSIPEQEARSVDSSSFHSNNQYLDNDSLYSVDEDVTVSMVASSESCAVCGERGRYENKGEMDKPVCPYCMDFLSIFDCKTALMFLRCPTKDCVLRPGSQTRVKKNCDYCWYHKAASLGLVRPLT